MTAADASSHASLRVVAPGATPFELLPPPVSGAAGSELVGFTASELPMGPLLVSACVATPIPGWVEDLRAPVAARAHAWTAKLAEAITGAPMELREAHESGEEAVLEVHAVAGETRSRGLARILVGFDEEGGARVLTCGVVCGMRRGRRPEEANIEAERACEAAVRSARLVGDAPAPAPGKALAAVAWGVHHPLPVAAGGISLAGVALLALVLGRRRPRSRL